MAMRQRQRLVISRQTGEASLTAETVDDDAGFGQRIRELKDSVAISGPVEARMLTALCDGCGARVELDFDHPELPGGWAATEHGDFCPGCQSLN
jgi:hypothetical protein